VDPSNPYSPPQSLVADAPDHARFAQQRLEWVRRGHRLVFVAIPAAFVVQVLGTLAPKGLGIAFLVLSSQLLVIASALLMTAGLTLRPGVKLFCAALSLTPGVNLFVLLVLRVLASEKLEAAGYSVGWFGTKAP
jgi:hypothetical protein